MGTPSFAICPLNALLQTAHTVAGVYTQPDNREGRGKILTASPVKSFAIERGLRVFEPNDLRTKNVKDQLSSLAPDLIVITAYGKILPKEILGIPRLGCLNIHPSLLPLHRGPSPVVSTILEGDEIAGVTLMILDEGMDSGPILARKEERIFPEDTTETLTHRLFEEGAKLLIKSLPGYLQGDLIAVPQDQSRATYTTKLKKEDGRIRWDLPLDTVARQIRAYSPWPGSYTLWKGRILKILQGASIYDLPAGSEPPGTVLFLPQGSQAAVGVVTGSGILGLLQVQLSGKQQGDAAAFVRGTQDFLGSHLG